MYFLIPCSSGTGCGAPLRLRFSGDLPASSLSVLPPLGTFSVVAVPEPAPEPLPMPFTSPHWSVSLRALEECPLVDVRLVLVVADDVPGRVVDGEEDVVANVEVCPTFPALSVVDSGDMVAVDAVAPPLCVVKSGKPRLPAMTPAKHLFPVWTDAWLRAYPTPPGPWHRDGCLVFAGDYHGHCSGSRT